MCFHVFMLLFSKLEKDHCCSPSRTKKGKVCPDVLCIQGIYIIYYILYFAYIVTKVHVPFPIKGMYFAMY